MSFTFKNFTIDDHRCAQKVGTDGVLLGAWAPVKGKRILDIGTGCGVIAMMIAQRCSLKADKDPELSIVGIDIDSDAIAQARENALGCKWTDCLCFYPVDLREFATDDSFDTIVCNPPFFKDSLHCPDNKRTMARHESSLPFDTLAQCASSLLKRGGTFSVILPFDLADNFIFLCQLYGLNLAERVDVSTVTRKPPKRSMLCFVKDAVAVFTHKSMTLQKENGERTEEYQQLTYEYYIK